MNTNFRSRHNALFIVVLSAALALSACSAIAELGPITDAGEAFMKAMQAKDHPASYHMLGAALQKEIGGVEGWDKFCEPRVPTEFKFTNKSINNGQGKVEGTATFANGQHMTVVLVLLKEGTDWKIAGINFQPV